MWWLRLRSPGKAKIYSLRTDDKLAAEMIAAPMIVEHKAALLAAKPRVELVWRQDFTPGLHETPDGKVFATERELHYLDAAGAPIRTAPNGGHEHRIINLEQRLGILFAPVQIDETAAQRPVLVEKNSDDEVMELYITQAGLNAARAQEARNMLHLFKRVVNKPLAKCTRDDGRKVVAALGDVKSSTKRRKMVPLVAMVNHAISEGKHVGVNPFASVVADCDDSERRLPFDDADMKLIRANLPKLSVQDQLLVRTLATCGLRLGEAFQIDREQTEGGCRFVLVGSKTEQSLRRVPLPAALLKHLPKKIAGPLFAGKTNAASLRLATWLREEGGITDTRKVAAHSYRHRMQDRLRAVGCPSDIREELLGHERKTVAASYGRGSPVPVLRKWLDKADGF
jgi:integrase